jgi:hypothetical protein
VGEPYRVPVPDDDLGWGDYCEWGRAELDQADYTAKARALLRGWARRARGEAVDLTGLEASLGPVPHDPMMEHAIPTLARPVTADELARITTDIEVQAGNEAPDAVLGLWADALDLYAKPAQRRALVHSLALWCFVRVDHRVTWFKWCRHKPRPPEPDRVAVHAIGELPLALYRVGARVGDRWILEPMVPLEPGFAPPEPVSVPDYGAVQGDLAEGGALLARVHPLQQGGWRAAVALALSAAPPQALVDQWLAETTAHARLWERRARPHRALRRFGHLFARRCHGWLWFQVRT